MKRIASHRNSEAAHRRRLHMETTNVNRRFAVRPLALALSMVLGAAGSAANAGDLKPDSLLAVDMNRSAVINNIVQTWQGQLSAENEQVLREALAKMRADRLLAAALAPSLDSLQAIMSSEESCGAACIAAKHHAGDADGHRSRLQPCGAVPDLRHPRLARRLGTAAGRRIAQFRHDYAADRSRRHRRLRSAVRCRGGRAANGRVDAACTRIHRRWSGGCRQLSERPGAVSAGPAIQHIGDAAAECREW